MIQLKTPIEEISKIAEKNKNKLKKLGITNVREMLWHIPVRWEDFSNKELIKDLKTGEQGIITATVTTIQGRTAWKKRKMHIIEGIVKDSSGEIKVVWFNQPFLLHSIQPGKIYHFSGKVVNYYGQTLSNPLHENAEKKDESIHFTGLTPIYPSTAKLSQKQMRYLMQKILEKDPQIKEHLTKSFLDEEDLMELKNAVYEIHRPHDKVKLQKAIERLKFEELFTLASLNKTVKSSLKEKDAYSVAIDEKELIKQLPFKLTHAQEKALHDIKKDLKNSFPMNRLLEGDVGSGKTIVVTMCAESIAQKGYQAAIMAPTEVLAYQHFKTFTQILNNTEIKITLLTRNYHMESMYGKEYQKEAVTLKRNIKAGNTSIVLGTHTLIQESVQFEKLALAVVDEQHRFGVKQRTKLVKINKDGVWPHFLSLTATPIPRTYAHLLYGTVEVSILNEKPQGRKEIITKIVENDKSSEIITHIKNELQNGRQLFVVCPLILESDILGVSAVESESEKIKKLFPTHAVGELHGKMTGTKKEEVLKNFRDKKIDILIATPVIEVGIDIPNATLMIIKSPERFGLAGLHQLRGRIGRSTYQSYCYLFTETKEISETKRLKALEKYTDGFTLAEIDLKERGPGEIRGVKQSGYLNLKIASLGDVKTIKKVQKALTYKSS